MPREPQRVEGPTPAGGAFALAFWDPSGQYVAEIVEYDEGGEQIARTYCSPRVLTVSLTEDEIDEEAERQGIAFRQPKRPSSPSPPEPPPPAKTP